MAIPKRVRCWLALASGATLLAILVAMLLSASPAHANSAPPYYMDGSIAAEPSGLQDVRIISETLLIDMRGLPAVPQQTGPADEALRRQSVGVSATYTLQNDGQERQIPLVFASGSPRVTDFRAALNGAIAASHVVTGIAMPSAWQPPLTTPSLEAGKPDWLYLPAHDDGGTITNTMWGQTNQAPLRERVDTVAFTITLPAGESTLAVNYLSAAQAYYASGTRGFKSYQFAYVLAPARAWGGFGDLDVSVLLPARWLAAARPALPRDGDLMHQSFAGLPDDALALTVAPPETTFPSLCASPLVGLVALLLGVVFSRR